MAHNGQNGEFIEENKVDTSIPETAPINMCTSIVDSASLVDNINELESENFPESWKQNFCEVLNKSLNYEYLYSIHITSWVSIVSDLSKWDSLLELFLDCSKVAIITMPLTPNETDDTWTKLIDMVHTKIMKDAVSFEDALPVLQLAEKKFGCSYSKASQYWNLIRTFELKLAKKNKLIKEERNNKIVEIYKKQFSKPYLNMAADWEKFKEKVKELKLDSDQKVEVQTIFLFNCAEAELIPNEYSYNLAENNELHHLKFGFWVETLLEKKPPTLDTVEVLCDEMIFLEPDSACYYHIFVKAVASDAFSIDPHREDKLFTIIKRGLTHGLTGCYNAVIRFIEHALLVASNILESSKFLEVVDLTIATISLLPCQNTWFYSRRAIITAVKNKILCGDMDVPKLKEVFQNSLDPVTLEYYKSSTLPEEVKYETGLDERLLELLKMWVLGERAIRQLSFPMTFDILKEHLEMSDSPLALLTYGDFIRCYGTYEEAEAAYKTSLNKLAEINNAESSTYLARKCHVQLLSNLLELQMIHGKASDQTGLSHELSRAQSLFTLMYNESYDTKSGFCGISTEAVKISDLYVSQSDESAISTKLKSLSMVSTESQENSKDTAFNETCKDSEEPRKTGHPLFISNLPFKASKTDIKKAFLEKGVLVLEVELRKNPYTQQSKGFGTLYLESKEKVKEVIEQHDRILILGRSAFLSWHRDDKQKPQNRFHSNPQIKLPTVLHLSEIPVEWRNPKKMELALSRHCQIQSITVNDKEEPVTAKIEFFMPEDTKLAYNILTEGDEFKDLGMIVRKCFSPKFKGKSSKMEVNEGEPETNKGFKHNQQLSKMHPEDGDPPAKRKFVPNRGGPKSHMKKRLSIPLRTDAAAFKIPNRPVNRSLNQELVTEMSDSRSQDS